MSEFSNLECVQRTVALRDPTEQTVVVGGGAMVAQMAEAGLEYPETKDVDAICSPEYFDELWSSAHGLKDVVQVTMRFPCDRWRLQGANNRSIDVNPDRMHASGILPWTAATSMGSSLYPINYGRLREEPDLVVRANGINCLKIASVLDWKASVGRAKDIKTLDQQLPRLLDNGLITDQEYNIIVAHRDESVERGDPSCPFCPVREEPI